MSYFDSGVPIDIDEELRRAKYFRAESEVRGEPPLSRAECREGLNMAMLKLREVVRDFAYVDGVAEARLVAATYNTLVTWMRNDVMWVTRDETDY
jgi:hypothetical protein